MTRGMLAAVALSFASARSVLAAEPILPNEPRIMREPGEVVDVPDAADGDDPVDIDIALTFRLDVDQAAIERVNDAGDVDEVGHASSLTSRLVPEVRVGVFHDLAAVIRLPIILSSTRTVDSSLGARTVTTDGVPLVELPFRSPERSGIEHLALGVLWGVMNQARSPALPSWTLGAEVEVSVGDAMTACVDPAPEGEVSCADPADVNRNGTPDEGEPDAGPARDPGPSARGTVALVLTTAISRRFRYVEPFGTMRARVELPLSDSPFETTSRGVGETLPPVRGEAELGIGVIPWENRERFSRVWLDARILGGFVTRGPDYSPLFDVIGASDSAALRAPTSTASGRVYSTGMTVVDAHGTLGASGSFVWRASELIELGLALAVRHAFDHVIAGDARCEDGGESCSPPSNPAYRAELNGPEGQFSVADSLSFQFAASGAVMF